MMTRVKAYEKVLEQANQKLEKLLQQHTKAGITQQGDLENMIDLLEEKITQYELGFQKAKEQQEALLTPSQVTIYCYVFTNTLNQIQGKYSYAEQKDWLKERYHPTQLEAWQPFITRPEPTTIEDILEFCQRKYNFKIIYWESEQKNYQQWDAHFSQSFAVLDLLALKSSNERGFLRYDSVSSKYVAPNCEETYQLFTKSIETTKSKFFTPSTTKGPLEGMNMDLFNRSDIGQLKETIHYFLEELSGNIHNKSSEDSVLRGMNFNLNAK